VWQAKAEYAAIAPLRRVQERVTTAHFAQLSHFLRHPAWEATNNGAERAGRAFRHQQAPHFNLRKLDTIEGALIVAACQQKITATVPPARPIHTCQRGRKRHVGAPPGVKRAQGMEQMPGDAVLSACHV
jgi:hypothetical protein